MIASAAVLPYDYALLGDGLVPIDLAGTVSRATLVLASEDSPDTARALVGAIPNAKFRAAPASMHELGPDEIAALITPFLTEPV